MPWKLLSFLATLILVTLFIGFNLDNRCNISLIVYTFHDVPIYISLLFAYVIGAVTLIPFFLAAGRKRARKDSSGSSGGTVARENSATQRKGGDARVDSRGNERSDEGEAGKRSK